MSSPVINAMIKNDKTCKKYSFSFRSRRKQDGSKVTILLSVYHLKQNGKWTLESTAFAYSQIPGSKRVNINVNEQVAKLTTREKTLSHKVIKMALENMPKMKEENLRFFQHVQKNLLRFLA